jgi:hypothetical protein
MNDAKDDWNAEAVRSWLRSRYGSAQSEQDRVKKRGNREDDYDAAAAEKYVLQLVKTNVATEYQHSFIDLLDDIRKKDGYRWAGVYDQKRFERAVRAYVRKLIKMAHANEDSTICPASSDVGRIETPATIGLALRRHVQSGN